MNYKNEFGTVELIMNSKFITKGVDSFSLALIKAEKQIRKLFTFLIFQNPVYCSKDCHKLRNILAENKNVYFEDFIKGINLILTKSLHELYGVNYKKDLAEINKCIKIRNKIFHGQLTYKSLSRDELIEKTNNIRKWCKQLASMLNEEIDYDGFGRNSFQKSKNKLTLKNFDKFDTIEKYKQFIKDNLNRKIKK